MTGVDVKVEHVAATARALGDCDKVTAGAPGPAEKDAAHHGGGVR